MPMRAPPEGLYDQLLTLELAEALERVDARLRDLAPLDAHDAPRALSRFVQRRLALALASYPKEDLGPQLALVNAVLGTIEAHAPDAGAEERLSAPARKLLAVRAPPETSLGLAVSPPRPRLPLSSSDLIVNGHHDVSLGPEVRRELASADRVDLLCSFLKWSGLRLVHDELAALLRRRPGAVRVLTTAYMSATERRALDALQALGAEVRVSYDVSKTRLHAKAWLFHRDSGFSTGCIGSSNLSAAAMLDGLEWNVRLSSQDNGPILEKFRATFEQYWSDVEFSPYDAEAFDRAVQVQQDQAARRFFVVDVLPRPHQQEMLDELEAERLRGHHRNLVVAATGTGKTIVAALDFQRLRQTHPRLLFVAHRREILEQSLDAFRAVLREGSFGELLVGGLAPTRGGEVFASIQSLTPERIAALRPDAFDVVIVDEFHHAAAESYERLLQHLTPRVLLGLTATPERADGKSVLHFFDGRVASELRLWKALDQGLLAPFQYFGVGLGLDLRGQRLWSGGRYDAERLSNLYTADDVVLLRVLQELERRVRDVHAMRALGFCVDVAHAEYMARRFTERGLPSVAVSARSPEKARSAALDALARGEVRVVFSVDLFNEGVDLPTVDTVLFLRPTESATIFLQQLGRGLRRAAGKECLTVLDFIGHAHASFRFDQRYRAIVGGTRRDVEREVRDGFPSLPNGCVIELDRLSQAHVLENIRQSLQLGRRALVEDLRVLGPDARLPELLARTGSELDDVYAKGWGFSELRRRAGFLPDASPLRRQMERGLGRMLHVDDAARLLGLRAFLEGRPTANAADPLQRMLFASLGFQRPYAELGLAWRELWAAPGLREELLDLLTVLRERTRWLPHQERGRLPEFPLRLHATYTRDEVLAALDERDRNDALKRPREGVLFSKAHQLDVFFVTLDKEPGAYTPTTLYEDYPLTPTRFHWQTQSREHEGTAAARRYFEAGQHGHEALLFVRQAAQTAAGETSPYVNLGPVRHVRHSGARPISIEWELLHAMPAWLFLETKRAAN